VAISAEARKLRRRALAHFSKADPAMADAVRRLEPCPVFPEGANRRLSAFAYLSRSIVFQQLATGAASTIWGRYQALGAKGRPPSAEQVIGLADDAFRQAGLSRNKQASLIDLASRVLSGELSLRRVVRLPDQAAVDELVQVRGIGPWTAEIFLMFKLGRPDLLPPADLGLQEGLRILDQMPERPTAKRLAERSQLWSPFRTHASWTLWRLVDEEREAG